MKNLLPTIKKFLKADEFEDLSNEELALTLDQIENLKQKIQSLIAVRSVPEEDTSDDEFIEIDLGDKTDLIKKDIQVLNISCNDFKKLPAPIYTLKKLKKLYLFNNAFSTEEKRKIRRSFPATVQIYF